MDNLAPLGNIVVGVLSVFTIIATALVGILFGSLKTLRDTANDLRARVLDLEKERAEDKAKIAEEEAKSKILQSMVTGKVEWVALTDQLEEHHRQALGWWRTADTNFAAIPNSLAALPEAVHDAVEQALTAVVPVILAQIPRTTDEK